MSNLDEKARQARNAYKREWNRKNQDKLKSYQQKYWHKKGYEIDGITLCKQCNQPFKRNRVDNKYCSDACRVKHYRNKDKSV